MARGLPYDSPEGRAWAGAISSLMTGHAYATSARTAARMGPFAGYADNADAMLNVLRMHRDRKSTRLNSSHSQISYAVFCLKKNKSDGGGHGDARGGTVFRRRAGRHVDVDLRVVE